MLGRSFWAIVAAGTAFTACESSAPLDPAPRQGADVMAFDERDPYGLGRLVGVMSAERPPRLTVISRGLRVRLVGRGALSPQPPEMPLDDGFPTSVERIRRPPSDGAFGTQRFRVFNGVTLNEFELLVSRQLLNEIHRRRAAAGLTSATEGVDDPEANEREDARDDATGTQADQDTLFGWSNGVDTRIRFTSTTKWPWRTVSQMTYGSTDSRCTSTLIGPRHVITAAHCLYDRSTNAWLMPTVTPGRNGPSVAPFGSSTVQFNPAVGTQVWFFAPWEWRNPDTSNPREWDWGMLVIPDRLGALTGWMGYVARPFGELANQFNYNRGYPSCDPSFVERPANCQTGGMYGDLRLCNLGSSSAPGPDGWPRLLSVSCDSGRGHSGSAVYHYVFDPALGKNVPVVSMMMVSHTCLTCTATDDFPNWNRRITPDALAIISFLRQSFP